MQVEDKERLETARRLMDDFAQRTGLTSKGGNIGQRYLWTDAFAVHTFFGLAHALADDSYHALALKLIEEVHQHLGRFHPSDERKGWISGLPEQQGRDHPTTGGLRIGKKLPERRSEEPFNEQLEWERDGQYFHYLTRWIQALLQAEQETGEKRYALWASQLLQAGGKFINKTGSRTYIYWKMNTDLSRPLVNSMGAHDPLDGLVCALSILERMPPDQVTILQPLIEDLKDSSRGLDWSTSDPLGIGGLLLNLTRVAELDKKMKELPEPIKPKKLLIDSVQGLEAYSMTQQHRLEARRRLAFRDCGLSLGLRAVPAIKEGFKDTALNLHQLDRFIILADEIEAFWIDPRNQQSHTWTEHLDINAVTLAASLTAV